MLIVLTIFIFTALALFLIARLKKTPTNNTIESKEEKRMVTGKYFADKLSELGYFKYAESSNISALKQGVAENFGPNSGIATIYDDETDLPMDYRNFLCDGERVSQTGGVVKLLSELSTAFHKIGFEYQIGESYEKWNQEEKSMNQWIVINCTKYAIYTDYEPDFMVETIYRIAKILNLELEKQQIQERIFLSDGGFSGRLHILTHEIQEYVCTFFDRPLVQPQTPDKWIKENFHEPIEIEWEKVIE